MNRTMVGLAVCLLAAGCGGGGGGSPDEDVDPPPLASALQAGVWEGSFDTGERVRWLIAESGESHLLSVPYGTHYFGEANSIGNQVFATLRAYPPAGVDVGEGDTLGFASVRGTVDAQSTLKGEFVFEVAGREPEVSKLSLTYNSVYERESSLAIIAGNFRDLATGMILSIDSNGEAFAQDAHTGCVLNGTVWTIDKRFNIYSVRYRYSACNGDKAAMNSAIFNGLAMLDNTLTPEVLIVGVRNVNGEGATRIAKLEALERT